MRPHVESVKSSIKGGVEALLGLRTLLLGVNGSGKSAIVNAVELAGTGRASDVAGRAVLARDADLAMLAPVLSEFTFAHAVLSQGFGLAAWELTRGHRAKRTGPEICFPLREVQEALLGSPETARKWILRHGGGFAWGEVLALVPASLQKRLASVQPSPPSPDRAPEALTSALETARKRARELKSTAKAARSLSPPSQPPPTAQDISALEAVIDAWGSRPEGGSALEILSLALEAVKLRIAALEQKARGIESEIAALPPPQPGIEVRRAAVLVVDALAQAQKTNCPICGGALKPGELAAKAQMGRERIAEDARLEDRRASLSYDHGSTLIELSSARRELANLETEISRAQAKAGKAKEEAKPLPTMTLIDAETALRNALAARTSWEFAQRSEERALSADREAQDFDELATALGKAMAVLVGKARETFVARVQRFLPRADLFGLTLLEGEREVLRVGLSRRAGDQMVIHAALSGAEWARVTAALALATAPPDGPCVVCPEERAFDPDTLSDVLAAFGNALGALGERAPQVIVTSPVAPREVPEGWTVVQLGQPLWNSQKRLPGKVPSTGAKPDLSSIFD